MVSDNYLQALTIYSFFIKLLLFYFNVVLIENYYFYLAKSNILYHHLVNGLLNLPKLLG